MAGPGKPGKPKGSPKTGGRVAGMPNKENRLTDDQRKALATAAGGITPLEFACSVLRDPLAPMKEKQWACEQLFPYMHRKLPMAVDVTQNTILTTINAESLAQMGDKELDALIDVLARITEQKVV